MLVPLILAILNLVVIGSIIVNPLWFLSVAARFAMLSPAVTSKFLVTNTVGPMKIIVRLAIGDVGMNDLSPRERRSVNIKLWLIRAFAVFASFFGIVVPILHARA